MRITLSSIKEAYLQLKRHLYYERLDLDARNRIVEFENEYDFDINGRLSTIDSWIKKYSNSDGLGKPVDALIAEIDLNVFVKKISRTDDLNTSNFITDKIHTSNFKLEKEHTFISIPVELQILGALWVNSIGINLDRKLIKHCYGNRLIKYDEAQDLSLNGRLFKIYHFQYARWWKTGLKKAKEILRKDKEDALILNFDLKSFYHSVCVNKQQLRTKIQYDKLSTKEKYLHRILEAVLDEYNQRLRKTKLDKNQEDWALPIGYLPSPLIANDYLDLFDKDIVKNVRPSYYGRYVDDIMVVFKSGTPKDSFARLKDEKSIAELNKLDKTDESREAVYRFLKYLGDRFIISKSESGTKIEIKGVKGAELQLEKLFVYELDRKSPSNLIESFIQDQNSKSYEFQFESEENDTVSKEFGNLLFTQSFEQEEASNAKIKRITQNKFEISVFLSRLIRRSTSSDAYVHRDQLKSVVSYYKGANCIESWTLWEKIILATVVNNDDQLFLKFINFCADSIESLASNINNDSKSRILIEHFENSMWMILEIAISNSIAANPKFIESDEISKFIEDYSLNLNHRGIRSAAFVRNEFTAFPLLGLTDEAIGSDVSYFSRKEISKFIESHLLSIRECFLEYSPVRVKYWQVCHLEWLNRLQQLKWKAGDEINTVTIEDELNFKKVQLPAFEKYFKINYKSRKDPHTIRKKYFFKVGEPKNGIDGPKKEELHVIASELKEKLRFGLVNEHVDKNHITEAAKGQLDLDGRLENCYRILDEVQSKGCDIAVQPELSVPFDYLWNYFAYSERHQLGLVSGIEHKRIRDVVFNFIMTVLPIKVEGVYNDAIPVMRLKNHFAPSEEEMIRGFRATVPKPAVYRYHLLHWRGLYFTNYYCYELADIKHRHIFQGEVDVLIAPVWNPDTNYYNGIVETGAREVHCVFSQVNTAEYGDTRWTIPAKTELKNPLKVKGGTTTDHPFTIALSDFNPKKLREFQNLGYNAQKKNGNYKPTPPNFPKDKAVKRLNQESFYVEE